MLKIGDSVSVRFFSGSCDWVVAGKHITGEYLAIRFNEIRDFFHSCDGIVENGFGYYVMERDCKKINRKKYLRYLK